MRDCEVISRMYVAPAWVCDVSVIAVPRYSVLTRAEEAVIDEVFAQHGRKNRWELVEADVVPCATFAAGAGRASARRVADRSEERRVGKAWRSHLSRYKQKSRERLEPQRTLR